MNKILIVEDNMDIAELIKDVLVKGGFEVLVCYDGLQAIELAHREQPDLILLDLMLPAGGGFHVLEKTKLSKNTRDIPIVILSASRSDSHKVKAAEMGVKIYLEKPYEPKRLVDTLQELLGGEKAEDQS